MVPPLQHHRDPDFRADCPDKHSLAFAPHDIQAEVAAIRKVDIDAARRAEHCAIADGLAAPAVRGRILAAIGLGLDHGSTHAPDKQPCTYQSASEVDDVGVKLEILVEQCVPQGQSQCAPGVIWPVKVDGQSLDRMASGPDRAIRIWPDGQSGHLATRLEAREG